MTAFYLTIWCFIQNQWKCFLAQNPYFLTTFIDKFRKLNIKKDLWVVCPYFKRWQLSLPSTGIRFDEGVVIAPAFLFSQSKPLSHILNFLTQRSHDIIFFSHFCNHFIMKVSVSSACIIFQIPFQYVLAFAISIFWLKEGIFCTLWYRKLIFSLQHQFRYLQQFSTSFLLS